MEKHYHLIGIGGIGMSGIAQLLLAYGHKVSGSDLKENRITASLKESGAQVFLGHNAGNIRGAHTVIFSSAIKEDNPELIEAKKQNLPLVVRARALAELMQDKTVITVSGSHGKTTTTSLVSYLLLEAGLLPTVAIGGILKNIDTNACLGSGKFFVAEADESDGSFLYYKPKYSIVTNIDREHLDYYKSFEKEIDAFREFLNRTDDAGCVFCSSDDANLINILKSYRKKYVLFGLKETSQIYPKNIQLEGLASAFDCYRKDKFVARFNLALGGEHNISNALAVIALGIELGIDLKFMQKALSGYKGARRRLEIKFKDHDYTLIDDYAHHPTEIRATLKGVANLKSKRSIAIFQPHRYTRTQLLLDEFAQSFNAIDRLVITDIYAASEPPIPGVNARLLCEKIKEHNPGKTVDFVPKEKIVEYILGILEPGDQVITLGAGDIAKVSDELAERLQNKS
ncbi:MAG: UDP-N-acetylmuramate--L-alanine ligase [Candidatus Omnitrophica bacterium]|nr:UDP-N-acetylmuramate--L-alanine ligase [Candidatus Omnitrophota bacterium]MDD5662174.1 UDP-N-acetylmuramate--L-alanine ligase [Candidatus Omnitrophota bacterium]